MRLKGLVLVSLISLVLIFPFFLYAQMPAPSETSQAIIEGEAQKFLYEYVARYMKMDIEAFMALFSKGATENRMLPYADIYENYRKYFSNSSSLSFHLQVYSIQPSTGSAFVSGRYEVVQSLKPKGEQHLFRGNIQWSLVREDGSLKVLEVNYGKDRGR